MVSPCSFSLYHPVYCLHSTNYNILCCVYLLTLFPLPESKFHEDRSYVLLYPQSLTSNQFSVNTYLMKNRKFHTLHVQFSSVAQSCPTLCNPMNRSTPGLPVHHQFPEFTQTHDHRVSDAIQPSHPVVPFSSCPQSQVTCYEVLNAIVVHISLFFLPFQEKVL